MTAAAAAGSGRRAEAARKAAAVHHLNAVRRQRATQPLTDALAQLHAAAGDGAVADYCAGVLGRFERMRIANRLPSWEDFEWR